MGADPHLRQRRHGADFGLRFTDVEIEGSEASLLLGGDDLAAGFGDSVSRCPRPAAFVGSDGFPNAAIQADLDFILGGRGPADLAFIRVTISACIDKSDALNDFGLGERELEFRRVADEPSLATLVIDTILRP